jgi:hypothetical protein
MSFRRMNNKTTAMIGADAATAGALPPLGNVVSPANLPLGAVVVTNLGLQRLASVPAGSDFLIVQGNGANQPLLKSEILNQARTTATTAGHKAATQQITAIGFNGTTGSLPTANDTSYFIKIRKNDNDAGNRSQPMSLFAQFKTDATGTQAELAFGLAKVGTKNMEDEPANGYLRFEVLSDGTLTAFAANVTVAYGSKEATSTGHGMTVGVETHIRIDGADYLATATDANTFTLNMPYQGESGVVLAAVAGTVAAATNFGVRLRGVAAPFDVVALRDFYSNRFTATFSDENVLVTHLQGATEGTGAWQRVAMDEYMTYGFEGMNEMISIPPRARDQYVIEGARYSALEIRWKESMDTLVTTHVGEGSVLVYLELTGAPGSGVVGAGTAGEELLNVLNVTVADLDEV